MRKQMGTSRFALRSAPARNCAGGDGELHELGSATSILVDTWSHGSNFSTDPRPRCISAISHCTHIGNAMADGKRGVLSKCCAEKWRVRPIPCVSASSYQALSRQYCITKLIALSRRFFVEQLYALQSVMSGHHRPITQRIAGDGCMFLFLPHRRRTRIDRSFQKHDFQLGEALQVPEISTSFQRHTPKALEKDHSNVLIALFKPLQIHCLHRITFLLSSLSLLLRPTFTRSDTLR